MAQDPTTILDDLHWLGRATFRLEGKPRLYFDPWNLPSGSLPADIILISRADEGHCSSPDVEAIRREDTLVVASPEAAARLTPPVYVLRAGEHLEALDVRIEALLAGAPGGEPPSEQASGIGFLLSIHGLDFYFAGATQQIPEMEALRCDVAILPVDVKLGLTAEQAVEVVRTLKANWLIPMLFDIDSGGQREVDRLRELSPIPVRIPARRPL